VGGGLGPGGGGRGPGGRGPGAWGQGPGARGRGPGGRAAASAGGVLTVGPLGVLDGLHRLGHHAVVRRHHQNHDVRGADSAGPHGGEGSVARGVQEGDPLP